MATYFKHLESNEGGKDAAALHYAKQQVYDLKASIKECENVLRFWEHVVETYSKTVCTACNGNRRETYYPAGTSPGQGARSSVPCHKCRPEESSAAKRKLDEQYRR